MEKALRNAPTYAVFVALIIQVTRVSEFGTRIGAGWLAWVYAFFLALTIYALSYWVGRLHYEVTATPEERAKHAQQMRMERLINRARRTAKIWLTLFILIDGSLNLAETMASLPTAVTLWEYAGAAVYGVFPTLAALGLGSLQAHIDKIPAGPSKASFISKLADKLLARMDSGVQVAPASDKQAPQLARKADKQEPSLPLQVTSNPDKLQEQGGQLAPASPDKLPLQESKQPVQVEALLAYWRDNPKASDKQVANRFGVKRQAIQQRRVEMTKKGLIRVTDKGIEIVGVPVQMQTEERRS